MPIDVGRFNWFEHLSNDTSTARRFYSEVLPWKVEDMNMPGMTYPIIKAGEKTVGGFAALPPGKKDPTWISYILVEDVEAAAKKVVANGGKTLMDAMDIPTVGRMQPIADPQGGALILFRPAEAGTATEKGPGTFHWNELWSPDAKASLAFYSAVFGYSHTTKEMPHGAYYVLESGGVPRGGIMQTPGGTTPTHWLPYVEVGDLDGAVQRLTRNGGKSEGDAITMPGVGRFAFVRDPQGARLGLITPDRP